MGTFRMSRVGIGCCMALAFLALGCSRGPDLEGYFVYSARGGEERSDGIYYATARGRGITRLLSDENARSPRMSADGALLYYSTQGVGGTEIAVFSLADNQIRYLTEQQGELAVRLQNEQLARERDEANQVEQFGYARSRRVSHPIRYDLGFPSPTPDGRFVAYAVLPRTADLLPVFRGQVFVTSVAGGPRQEITGDNCVPDWRPQGYTAVGGGGGVILRYDFGDDPMEGRMDDEASRIYRDRSAQGEIQDPSLSHDGERVAWVQGQSLSVMPSEGGDVLTLASSRNFRIPAPGVAPAFAAWSPDDQFIAVVCGLNRGFVEGVIYVFRADGEPIRGNYKSIQVDGIQCRVDAFDWVADIARVLVGRQAVDPAHVDAFDWVADIVR